MFLVKFMYLLVGYDRCRLYDPIRIVELCSIYSIHVVHSRRACVRPRRGPRARGTSRAAPGATVSASTCGVGGSVAVGRCIAAIDRHCPGTPPPYAISSRSPFLKLIKLLVGRGVNCLERHWLPGLSVPDRRASKISAEHEWEPVLQHALRFYCGLGRGGRWVCCSYSSWFGYQCRYALVGALRRPSANVGRRWR